MGLQGCHEIAQYQDLRVDVCGSVLSKLGTVDINHLLAAIADNTLTDACFLH